MAAVIGTEHIGAKDHKVEPHVAEVEIDMKNDTTVSKEETIETKFNASGFALVNDTIVHDKSVSANVVCEFRPSTVTRTFDCEYPSVDPNVTRVREAIPFPKDLETLIAWTDVFVDRIASETKSRKEQNKYNTECLVKEVKRLEVLVNTKSAEVAKLQDALNASKRDAESLRCQVETLTTTVIAKDQQIKKLEETHKAEIAKLQQCNNELSAKLDQAIKSKNELAKKAGEELAKEHEKWEREHKWHEADHRVAEELRKLLAVETEKKITAEAKVCKLEADVEAKKKEILTLKTQICEKDREIKDLGAEKNRLKSELLVEREAHCTTKENLKIVKAEFEKVKKSLECAQKTIEQITKELKQQEAERKKESQARLAAEAELEKTKRDLCDAIKKSESLAAQLADSKSQIAALEKANLDLLARIAELEATISTLNCTIETLNNDKKKLKHANTCLKADLARESKLLQEAREDVDQEKAEYKTLREETNAKIARLQEEINQKETTIRELDAQLKKACATDVDEDCE